MITWSMIIEKAGYLTSFLIDKHNFGASVAFFTGEVVNRVDSAQNFKSWNPFIEIIDHHICMLVIFHLLFVVVGSRLFLMLLFL